MVGALDQLRQGGAVIALLHAGRERDGKTVSLKLKLHPLDRHTHVRDDGARVVDVLAGDEEAELFPAPAGDRILPDALLHEQRRELAEHIVPAVVAVGVVHALEEVDVRDGHAVHLRRVFFHEALHLAHHVAAVEELGERVRLRLVLKLLKHLLTTRWDRLMNLLRR